MKYLIEKNVKIIQLLKNNSSLHISLLHTIDFIIIRNSLVNISLHIIRVILIIMFIIPGMVDAKHLNEAQKGQIDVLLNYNRYKSSKIAWTLGLSPSRVSRYIN